MSQGNQVITELREKLQGLSGEAAENLSIDRPMIAAVSDDVLSVSVSGLSADRYSLNLAKITLSVVAEKASDHPEMDFSEKIENLEKTISYLPETLSLIEIENGADRVQMRSTKPYAFDDYRQYFEIMIEKSKELSFARFQKKRDDSPRFSIPFVLTEDIAKRLVDDLAQVLR